MPNVFVYGTLKRGYGNHRLLLGETYLGDATSVFRGILRHAGFPVLFLNKNSGQFIRGEMFQVNSPITMQRLDALESEGSMYDRRSLKFRMTKTGEVVEAFVYVGNVDHWRRHIERLPFCPIEDRHYYWDRPG